VIVVRYADDVVLGFQHLGEAQRFLADLKERLGAFALELHPTKTRIIEFGRFAAHSRTARGLGRPETFAFLGFTHICGENRRGGFIIRRHTIRERLRAKLHEVKDTLYRMRHSPIDEQGRYLGPAISTTSPCPPTTGRSDILCPRRLVLAQGAAAPRPHSTHDLAQDEPLDRPVDTARTSATPASRRALRRHIPRWEPGAIIPLAGICAGGGEQSPSLPRHLGGGTVDQSLHSGSLRRREWGTDAARA
jgi:hypothetical protein